MSTVSDALTDQSNRAKVEAAAELIFESFSTGRPCRPVRNFIGLSIEDAYSAQAINTKRWVAQGRRIVGRKIGLTSTAVQRQLGVDQPDFGVLFADMEYGDNTEIPWTRLHQPKVECEIALILDRDLSQPSPTVGEIVRSIGFVLPALEIVGSRIENWDIKISDTIADNASSGLYVLGGPARSLTGIDLVDAPMKLWRNGAQVGAGVGSACLGSPLNAAAWLAAKMVDLGTPLRAGDIILTGALGAMLEVKPGDRIDATIGGVGAVHTVFGLQSTK